MEEDTIEHMDNQRGHRYSGIRGIPERYLRALFLFVELIIDCVAHEENIAARQEIGEQLEAPSQ